MLLLSCAWTRHKLQAAWEVISRDCGRVITLLAENLPLYIKFKRGNTRLMFKSHTQGQKNCQLSLQKAQTREKAFLHNIKPQIRKLKLQKLSNQPTALL